MFRALFVVYLVVWTSTFLIGTPAYLASAVAVGAILCLIVWGAAEARGGYRGVEQKVTPPE